MNSSDLPKVTINALLLLILTFQDTQDQKKEILCVDQRKGLANKESPQFTAAAAATAKSPQSCRTLCDPIDGSPPGSPIPGILQARTLEWVAISFSNA